MSIGDILEDSILGSSQGPASPELIQKVSNMWAGLFESKAIKQLLGRDFSAV